LLSLFSAAAFAQDIDNKGIDDGTSLGGLTSASIAAGFDQGGHASDPSGNGVGGGKDIADQPRAGLANVFEQGNLSSTIDLIDGD